MAGFTNKGAFTILGIVFRAATAPTTFYLALATNAVAPTADTNTLSELTQVTGSFGYTTNGTAVARNATDFDTLTENDSNDRAELQLKDYTWTAAGGTIANIRYAVLTDDNATPGSRVILVYWDLGSLISLADGQSLTLQNLELRLSAA